MVRKLKFHEEKLLKKVDFVNWKTDSTLRESEVIRRYHLQSREDYTKYNRICGQIRQMANKISLLDPKDPFRSDMETQLLEKLYFIGVINQKHALSLCEKVSVSAFCRRRLPVVMLRLKMAENIRDATRMIEQGHIRAGPHCVTDPAFLVDRNMEDFVTWVNTSAYKRKIMKYNDKLDDFDLLD
ncbi:hypothetical protein MIR68_001466 [Amoeboaphelidium protococcarum]|nr:hypothetical protein MIR68_001466 [Amoeboaphelidium protococcarum]